MFISIKYKLFLTLLSTVIIVLIGMFFLIHWSFNRGFINYVNMVEAKRVNSLAISLQKAYSIQKSWRFLQGNEHLWHQFLASATPEGIQQFDPLISIETEREQNNRNYCTEIENLEHNDSNHKNAQQLTPRNKRRNLFGLSVILMDTDMNLIAGPTAFPKDMKTTPLRSDGATIGYLGHILHKHLFAKHQLQFIQDQRKSLAGISLLIAIIAAFIAFPVTSKMVRRINALAHGTHRLAAGKYDSMLHEGATDELGELTRDFNRLSLALKKNEQMRKQWAADISHELRTPIAILRAEIEALQDGIRPFSPEAVQSLHAEVLQLGRLVEDLFQLSLADIGALTYRKEKVELLTILEQAATVFRSKFAQKQITVTMNIQKEKQIYLFADAERLLQLFNNLLVNSLRYTAPKGELQISCTTTEKDTEIIFQDSSPGVPKVAISKLFDRLFRVESSRNRTSGGAGLGLALCKNIVEAHGGSIGAEPSPIGGLVIRISFPVERTI